jgi:hypothetical protein
MMSQAKKAIIKIKTMVAIILIICASVCLVVVFSKEIFKT